MTTPNLAALKARVQTTWSANWTAYGEWLDAKGDEALRAKLDAKMDKTADAYLAAVEEYRRAREVTRKRDGGWEAGL